MRRVIVPPANPLIMAGPPGTVGNRTAYYDPNGRQRPVNGGQEPSDYTQEDAHLRVGQAAKPLPLFGYSFFESARQIILARRAYLRRRYGISPPGSLTPPNDLTTGAPRPRRRLPQPARPPQPGQAGTTGSNARGYDQGTADQDNAYQGTAADQGGPDQGGTDQNRPGIDTTDQEAAAAYAARRARRSDSAGVQGDVPQDEVMQGGVPQGDVTQGGMAPDTTNDLGASTDLGTLNSNPETTDTGRGPESNAGYDSQSYAPGSQSYPPGTPGRARRDSLNPDLNPDALSPNAGTPYGVRRGPNASDREQFNEFNYGQNATPAIGPYSEADVAPGPVDAYHEVADPLSELYRNVNATVPASYQLSAGDVLTVRYWSPTMESRESTVTVDAQDAVMIPGIGRLVVRGLTASQAEHTLRARLRRLYNGADVTITLREPRTVSVTVSGEAFAPGTYNVPAVSTAFNVLYAAGGPTTDGSLRVVEVRRAGRLIGTLDVYRLLLGGGQFTDISLQPGDLISVSPRQSRVAVEGEVRQPAIYELKDRETLRDALRFARGVKPSGVVQHVEIKTVRPGAARVLKDVNLTDAAQVASLPLYDGDVVDVFSVRATLANLVSVAGAVDQPGDYAWQPGLRVADLLERARGPLPEAYTTRADLYRWNPDNTTTLIPVSVDRALAHEPDANIPLARWDRLQVYTRQDVAWTGRRDVTVRGAVQRPGVYTRSENMHARDLLLKAGGPTPEASLNHVVLLHQRPDGSFDYNYVSLAPDSTEDPLLQDNDILAVYTAQQAQFTPGHIVTILGEVVAPGPYPRGDGMHLSDLLKLAGGFRPGAATHVSIAHAYKATDDPTARPAVLNASFDAQHNSVPGDDVQLQDGDVVTVQGTGGFRDHVSVVMVKGAVQQPGPVILTDKMRLSDAIRVAGGLRDVAYPPGAEFTRQSERLTSGEQRSQAQIISRLNDLLNQSAYRRELAKSDIERIKATQTATQGNTGLIPLGNTSAPAAAPNPAAAALATELAQHGLVSTPRTLGPGDLQPNGTLAVNLAGALKRPGGAEDIPLMDGDTITVPERPTTVQVVGAVFNARGVMYKPGASLDYYISRAGGFAPDAASDRIEVIRAGGGLIPASKAGALQPGDLILVPTKVLAEKISRSGNGFGDFFAGLAGTAVTLKVLSSLFGL
ncbi:MAG: SLBB domain-containing protein [Armatimonadetes bacterium]|nr:SLBB domain-containing protein [Armatimonadota bacterium]